MPPQSNLRVARTGHVSRISGVVCTLCVAALPSNFSLTERSPDPWSEKCTTCIFGCYAVLCPKNNLRKYAAFAALDSSETSFLRLRPPTLFSSPSASSSGCVTLFALASNACALTSRWIWSSTSAVGGGWFILNIQQQSAVVCHSMRPVIRLTQYNGPLVGQLSHPSSLRPVGSLAGRVLSEHRSCTFR